MNKKAIVFAILTLAVLSLSSCRSKKQTCDVQEIEQVEVASVEVE